MRRALRAKCVTRLPQAARSRRFAHAIPEGEIPAGERVYEIKAVDVRPGGGAKYMEHAESAFKKGEGASLWGLWQTNVGREHRVIEMWEYDCYDARTTAREMFRSSMWSAPNWDPNLIVRERTSIVHMFDFWNLSIPKSDGIFELRTYRIAAGQVWAWKEAWKTGYLCRAKYVEPVGAWFSELGHLNTVWHLWHYEDLNHRREARELAWQEDGWRDNLKATLPLIQSMEADILIPHPGFPRHP